MNKFSKVFLVIGAIVIIAVIFISMANSQKMVVVKKDNLECKPLEIELGKFQDSDCGMIIESQEFASQVCAKDGKTWFFHDHGGMVHWLQDKDFKKEATIWVWAKDSKKWIKAENAFFSRNDVTPMNYGFGAYEHNETNLISFEHMGILMLRGENMTNPFVAKALGKK